MTDSIIPYSFVPGTKAKASEVNANFIALADVISENIDNINNINTTLEDELFIQKNVSETNTNLNDYKRKGIYFFGQYYIPLNVPRYYSGTLLVIGDIATGLKQIWFCDGVNPEIYTRNYLDSTWSAWNSILGQYNPSNQYYLKMPNGLIIQGGFLVNNSVTFPIAYTQAPAVTVTKIGISATDTTSDQGIFSEGPTGFVYNAYGNITGVNWIAIGF